MMRRSVPYEVVDLSLADALDGRQESSDAWIEALLFNVDTAKQIPRRKKTTSGGKRFAVYARYSRSTQKQSSIERQNENCLYYLDLIGVPPSSSSRIGAERGDSKKTELA